MSMSFASYSPRDTVDNTPSADPFAPAQVAFDQTLKSFKEQLAKNPRKHGTLQNICSHEPTSPLEVLTVVAIARRHYEAQRSGSKVSQGLADFSARMCYYGNIMDVLVQHHPEYVSLAWGAFKLLFDILPRVQLLTSLFPSATMKRLVAKLYARILEFIRRALEWYEERKIMRVIHSITRPASLHYQDLLDDIRAVSQSMKDLAMVSSQAEQRSMHMEFQHIHGKFDLVTQQSLAKQETIDQKLEVIVDYIEHLRQIGNFRHTLDADKRIDVVQTLAGSNLSDALAILCSRCPVDHISAFNVALTLRNRRSWHLPFLGSADLSLWSTSAASSSIHIRSSYKNRHQLHAFRISVIQQLRDRGSFVLWILKGRSNTMSATDACKSLLCQALSFSNASNIELRLPSHLCDFSNGISDSDCARMLAEILSHFGVTYFVVESEAIDPAEGFRVSDTIAEISKTLAAHGSGSVFKVMLFSHMPTTSMQLPQDIPELKLAATTTRRNGANRDSRARLTSRKVQRNEAAWLK